MELHVGDQEIVRLAFAAVVSLGETRAGVHSSGIMDGVRQSVGIKALELGHLLSNGA